LQNEVQCGRSLTATLSLIQEYRCFILKTKICSECIKEQFKQSCAPESSLGKNFLRTQSRKDGKKRRRRKKDLLYILRLIEHMDLGFKVGQTEE
jgi:hypothetical protein